ncbi:hypothetical protein RB595_009005 [Gaeumannomyces hyphopodioides]
MFNLACIGMVGPHFLLGLAVGQLLNAKRSVKMLRQLPGGEAWTLRHGFFANMGGFYIRAPDYPNGFPINGEQLAYLIRYENLEFPTLTRQDINRRNQVDGLSKFITIWQVTWFIITQAQRLAKGYTITTLEITALSFCANTIATSACWYYKPSIEQSIFLDTKGSVTIAAIRDSARSTLKTHPNLLAVYGSTPLDFISPRPIHTGKFWHYLSIGHSRYAPLFTKQSKQGHWERIPSNVWLEVTDCRWGALMAVIMVPFSVTFLAGWDLHFATTAELNIWRFCAIYHTIFNLLGCPFYIRYYVAGVMKWARAPFRRLAGVKASDNEDNGRMRAKSDGGLGQRAYSVPAGKDSPGQRGLKHARASFTANGTLQGQLLANSCTASGGSSQPSSHHYICPRKGAKDEALLGSTSPLWFFCFLYLVCRLYIYIESLVGLRSQPRGVYMTVNKLLPFIS